MRQQSRKPDGGPVGQIKGLLSQNIYSKRESQTTTLSLTEQRQKAARQRKIPLIRKSYSLYLRVKLQKGVDEVGEDADELEPVEPITIHVTAFGGY